MALTSPPSDLISCIAFRMDQHDLFFHAFLHRLKTTYPFHSRVTNVRDQYSGITVVARWVSTRGHDRTI